MRAARFLAIAFVLAAITAVTAGSVSTPPAAHGGPHVAAVQITAASAGGPQGVAYPEAEGPEADGLDRRLGPSSQSASTPGTFMDRTARAGAHSATPWPATTTSSPMTNGVAYVRIATTTTFQVIRRGFYINVHEFASDAGVGNGITCGNIRRTL